MELRTLTGHESFVKSVSFSPDGKRLASASFDTTIKLWDARNGAEIRTLTGHRYPLTSVSFSPDGQRLVSASGLNGNLGEIKLWDAQSGAKLHTLIGHAGSVMSVSFSPDGQQLASVSTDKMIKLWDARSGLELHTLTGHKGAVWDATFSSDGQLLASAGDGGGRFGGRDGEIKLWDAHSGVELHTIAENAVSSVCFSSDGKRLVAATGNRTGNPSGMIKLWDARRGAELRTFIGHLDEVTHLCFSSNSEQLFSGDRGGGRMVWNVTDGVMLPHSLNDFPAILKGAFDSTSTDGQWPAVSEGSLLFSEKTDAQRTTKNDGSGEAIGYTLIGFPFTFDDGNHRSPDGRMIAVPDGQRIRLIDLSPPSDDELIYREAKAKLDPWWQREQTAKAELEQEWYAVTFHRTWLVKANPDDTEAWTQLRTAAAKTVAENQPLPPVTVQLYQARNEPLPAKNVE